MVGRQLSTVWTGFAVTLAFGTLAFGGVARGQVTYTSDALFSAQGRSVWASGPGLSIDTGNQFFGTGWSFGHTYGGVDCFLGACFGAQIGADTHGRLGVDYGLKANSGTFDAQVLGQTSITVPDGASGNPKNIGPITFGTGFVNLPTVQTSSSIKPLTSVLQVNGPTVQGHLGLEGSLHAFAGAQVCVGVCYGPAFAPPDFGKSLQIASINEGGTGTLTVLGQTVSANQNVSALGGLVNASIRVPNLDSSSAATPGGYAGGVLTSTKRDNVAAMNANISQIVADAAGFPIPLAGNFGPFGYNLLQVNAGTALDIQQSLSLTPSLSGSLAFSSLVTPVINGTAGALTGVIHFKAGDSVTFRPGQVSALSVIPTYDLTETVHNTTDLVINGNVDVQALAVDIAGLSVGPLVHAKADPTDITSISLFNSTFTEDLGSFTAAPIRLDFTCSQQFGGGEFPSFGFCSASGYPSSGTTSAGPNGMLQDGYDFFSCGAYLTPADERCLSVSQIGYTSPYLAGPHGKLFVAGDNPLGYTSIPVSASTTDASAVAQLAALGYTPGAAPFDIPMGESAQQIVPEPAAAPVLGVGLALIALAGRRRRRVPAGCDQPA